LREARKGNLSGTSARREASRQRIASDAETSLIRYLQIEDAAQRKLARGESLC